MIDEQKARDRAYSLWEQRGGGDGSADDHWHDAIQQLESEAAEMSELADISDSGVGLMGVEAGVRKPTAKVRSKKSSDG